MAEPERRRLGRTAAVGCGLAAVVCAGGFECRGQSVISAQAGLIHYTEGRVLLNRGVVQTRGGRFPQMQAGDELATRSGRAEVLLNPKTFLRVRENSTVRLASESLTESRFELLRGSASLEVTEVQKGTSILAILGDIAVVVARRGVYRLDATPAALRVFEGEAVVTFVGAKISVGKGKMLSLDRSRTAVKFDRDKLDAFDQWSSRRANSLAMANLRGSGGGGGRAGGRGGRGTSTGGGRAGGSGGGRSGNGESSSQPRGEGSPLRELDGNPSDGNDGGG